MSLLRSHLESNAVLPASDLEAAARHQQAQGGSFDTALLELGLLSAADLDLHLGKACGLPTAPARLLETGPARPWGHVPKALLDIGWVLPLALEDGLVLAAVHPDLPDARLGALYRQIRGFTPMVTPECCLVKLSAERTGAIVAPRYAMLVLDVLDALRERETTTGTPVSTPMDPPAADAPIAPAPAAFTIPYGAAGPLLAAYIDSNRASETSAEPVRKDSTSERPTAANPYLTQPVLGDSQAASAQPVPQDSQATSAQPVPQDSQAASAQPVPQDSQPAPATSAAQPAHPAPATSAAQPAHATPAPSPAQPAGDPGPAPPPAHEPRPAPVLADSIPAPVLPDSSLPPGFPDRRAPILERRPIGTTTAPASQDSRPADPAHPTPRNHPRSGGVATTRTAPLPQLPLAQRLAPARAALAQARERDRITESLVRAAIQVAPRVALFGVKREGLRALAAPGSSLHLPRSLVIPIPDGSLLDRAVSGEIRLRLLTEPQLAFAVGRPLGIPCILEPVYAQGRCVLMLYIDRSGGPFDASEQTAVRDLCDVARSSLEALLRIMGMGIGPRPDASRDPLAPAESATSDTSAYVATPTPAPSPDAWLARNDAEPTQPEPTSSPASPSAPAPAEPTSTPTSPPAEPTSATITSSADSTAATTRSAEPTSAPTASSADSTAATTQSTDTTAASESTATTKPEQPARSADMDGVPELTRRPRRAVIALVNPIRREPTSGEPSLTSWVAARDQYAHPDAPPVETTTTHDADVTPQSDPPPVATTTHDADVTPQSDPPPVATTTVNESDAPTQSDPHAPTRRFPIADTSDPAAPDATITTPAPSHSPAVHENPYLASTSAASSDSPAADTNATTPASSHSLGAELSGYLSHTPPAPSHTLDAALSPYLAPATPAPSHSSTTTAATPVPSHSLADATSAETSTRPPTGPTGDPAPRPTPSSPDSEADPPAPALSDSPPDDPDPSASTSGLHMPNLVAPGVRRGAGKRGDRTRPVEPAVVIPYDLRRPEHRTTPPKSSTPTGLQIPASLIAPAPLPGSTRRGKTPQHPTPPRADDVTLNMPRLVRAPTAFPLEPSAETPTAASAPLEIQVIHIPAQAARPTDLSEQTAAPAQSDLSERPAAPGPEDLSEQPAVTDTIAGAPTTASTDLSQQPADAAPTSSSAAEPDDALAAYLQRPDDAALATLRALGPAVYPHIAARFPGPIDPRSASDMRSFPPPSVHGPLLRACVEIGESITPHILELLEHQRPQIRFYAAFLFQELRDPRSLRPLADHAFDPDPDVRLIATRVLESYTRTPGFDAATEQVRAALDGRDRDRALLATEAAGTLRDTHAVPQLIDLLSVRDKQIRETALEALCSITAKHHGYRPAKWRAWYDDHGEQPRIVWVMDALKHRDPAVRRWAADELTRVTGHRIPPPPEGEKITPRYVLHAWDTWWSQHGDAFR